MFQIAIAVAAMFSSDKRKRDFGSLVWLSVWSACVFLSLAALAH